MQYSELEKIAEPIIRDIAAKLARKWIGCRVEELELAQVARIKIWTNAHTVDKALNPNAWIATSAYNAMVTHLRAITFRNRGCVPIIEEIAGDHCNHLRACDTKMEADWLIGHLHPQYKRVARLYCEGFSPADIAKILGCHRGQVSKMMKVIRATGREAYRREYAKTL